jgi:dephospho-CoA kinase
MISLPDFYGKPLPHIGLIGKTRSGKDHLASTLHEMGFNVRRVAFGDIMKEKFFELFPHIPKNPKPTRELIHFGEAMRDIDPLVWVRPTMARAFHLETLRERNGLDPVTYVFSDIRNIHEYEAVLKMGATMVKIEAHERVRIERMLELGERVSSEILRAPTETAMDDFMFHYKVQNNGSLEDFNSEITQLIYQIQMTKGTN